MNKNIAVLLCHGDSDQVVSPQVGELTKKKVTEFVPNLTTKIYRGLGHSSSEEVRYCPIILFNLLLRGHPQMTSVCIIKGRDPSPSSYPLADVIFGGPRTVDIAFLSYQTLFSSVLYRKWTTWKNSSSNVSRKSDHKVDWFLHPHQTNFFH